MGSNQWFGGFCKLCAVSHGRSRVAMKSQNSIKTTNKSETEGGKWEDLQIDCLVNIFGRLGMESLIVDVPFVCKSWYKATLDPLCWKQLHFPDDPSDFLYLLIARFGLDDNSRISEPKLIKGLIDRSAGLATTFDLRNYCDLKEGLIYYIADKCPALKNLVVWVDDSLGMKAWSLVIGKLKNLESFEITTLFEVKDIITEIGSHCENFASLKLVGVEDYYDEDIEEEDIRAIVTCLPKLKFLALRYESIDREKLIKIIKGCVNLECLDVRWCVGFDKDDAELSKLASHIPTFLRAYCHSIPW